MRYYSTTLRAIRKEWIANLKLLAELSCFGSIVVCLLLFWMNEWDWYVFAFGFLLSFFVEFVHDWCFYNLVTCPQCGGKLNKFKNGKNVPMKQAYTQLGNGYGCRHCGWKPEKTEVGADVA